MKQRNVICSVIFSLKFKKILHNDFVIFLQDKTDEQAMTINSLENTLLEINKEKKNTEAKLQKVKNLLKGILAKVTQLLPFDFELDKSF